LANRGLAGIDGTISTASGVALAGAARFDVTAGVNRVLIGDLTLLHDAGALLAGRLEERPQLQIIVVDDDGGGIFSGLEHGARAELGSRESAQFERVFGTPQQVDLAALCAGYGVQHQIIDDVESLRSALSAPPKGISLIQVRVDRSGHRQLSEQIRLAVDNLSSTETQ
jgi:2-succinyl-5-enolpyruvyl-6-hydroxy-3-cyclohexene-1-carboxylate synthase